MEDIVADPHFADRQQVLSIESTEYGHTLQPGIVPVLTATPGRVAHRAPNLGENNEEVFGGLLGMTPAEMEALKAKGLV
jgi:formyl-CoA transferase